MLTLCIDTSAGTGVALVADGVLASATTADPRRHAEALAPMVHRVLAEARVPRGDLDAVVAGTGPAPFTGLRVGLVTARTLARGLGVPVHGISSLDVLARQTLDADGPDQVVVATDARRREVYWARYRALGDDDVDRLTGPHVQAPGDVPTRTELTGPVAVVGPGAPLLPGHGAGDGGPSLDPAVLARILRARLARRATGASVELGTEPMYLRRPDVQPPSAPKRARG